MDVRIPEVADAIGIARAMRRIRGGRGGALHQRVVEKQVFGQNETLFAAPTASDDERQHHHEEDQTPHPRPPPTRTDEPGAKTPGRDRARTLLVQDGDRARQLCKGFVFCQNEEPYWRIAS